MLRLLTIVFLTLFASLAHADDWESADKAWSRGKPWPSHWGLVKYPYQEGWNVIVIAFVNKVYDKDEAAGTKLKHIEYAMKKDASVEVCTFKKGMFRLAAICKDAVVDQDIIGTLKENDIVAFFYPNHGTRGISKGPGSDARTTMRVFQKLSTGDDPSCWQTTGLIIHHPTAKACFDRIDMALVERLLTRDFGPRAGVDVVSLVITPAETVQNAIVAPVNPSRETSAPVDMATATNDPEINTKSQTSEKSFLSEKN